MIALLARLFRRQPVKPDPRAEAYARWKDARRRNDTRAQAQAHAENYQTLHTILHLGPGHHQRGRG